MFLPTPDPDAVRRAQSADGVALLSVAGTVVPPGTDAFMTAYALRRRDLARHVVLGGPTFRIPARLDWHLDPSGIVDSQDMPVTPTAEGKALATTLATAFPGLLSKDPVIEEFVGVYAEAADAIVQALDAAHGDLGGGQRRFRDRKSTRLNSSHIQKSRMPSSA